MFCVLDPPKLHVWWMEGQMVHRWITSAHLGHKGHQLLPIREKGSRGHKREAFLVASGLERFGDREQLLEL